MSTDGRGHLRGEREVPTVPELLATDALLDRLGAHRATEGDLADTVARLLDAYATHADPETAGVRPLELPEPAPGEELPAAPGAPAPRVLVARRRTLERLGRGTAAACAVLALLGGTAAAAATGGSGLTGSATAIGSPVTAVLPEWFGDRVMQALGGTAKQRVEREVRQAQVVAERGNRQAAVERLGSFLERLRSAEGDPQLVRQVEYTLRRLERETPVPLAVDAPSSTSSTGLASPDGTASVTLPELVQSSGDASATPSAPTTEATPAAVGAAVDAPDDGSPTSPRPVPSTTGGTGGTGGPSTPLPAQPTRGGGAGSPSTGSPSTGSPSTPTRTPAQTPTGTPTGTPTDTPTGTPTDSPTGTPTDDPTGTPTDSATGTPTGTPTDGPTGTPTGTPTDTPATDDPSASPAPTGDGGDGEDAGGGGGTPPSTGPTDLSGGPGALPPGGAGPVDAPPASPAPPTGDDALPSPEPSPSPVPSPSTPSVADVAPAGGGQGAEPSAQG
ncbi:hypothetical protein [Kineococcus gypseus]|uniref:hypothetical protein n=1 Tax=Kineococcus gypseus TaxID=1637102 RepID=UPI003D7D4EC2